MKMSKPSPKMKEPHEHDDEGEIRSATKKVRVLVEEAPTIVPVFQESQGVVTPSGARARATPNEEKSREVRRSLFSSDKTSHEGPVAVTPARSVRPEQQIVVPAKRKLLFGRLVTEVIVQENVRKVYSIVRKLTGSIGGNGSCGPIYGELTIGSMQKVINAMREHTEFNEASRFIDVGSGIGKPNLHVCQDPGVEFSYGVEIEPDRWLLGMTCLKGVFEAATKQTSDLLENKKINHRCVFECGDISNAQSFDPFTHVYMFSCGFPPGLWLHLSEMWNRSTSPYLICYSGPKHMIVEYEFELELIKQLPTSMHGSKEGHMAYIYRRSPMKPFDREKCDYVFRAAWESVKGDSLESLKLSVAESLKLHIKSGRTTRTQAGRK